MMGVSRISTRVEIRIWSDKGGNLNMQNVNDNDNNIAMALAA